MKTLWAPWRMDYLKSKDRKKGCVFCHGLKRKNGEKSLILYVNDHSFINLNKYPYNSGHMMVLPKRHVGAIEDLNKLEYISLFETLRQAIAVLKRAYKPEGINIGLNLGAAAGAGIRDHIHFHLVPRWHGDTNFMPLLGETKVVSEHLRESFKRLSKQFNRLRKKP